MSTESLPPAAIGFFQDVFPDAVVMEPLLLEDARDERLAKAGLGLAEVLFMDGSFCQATYIARETPFTEALSSIYFLESDGELPAGTHERAIDSIITGEFVEEFGCYLP
jgi:hypothetical protein